MNSLRLTFAIVTITFGIMLNANPGIRVIVKSGKIFEASLLAQLKKLSPGEAQSGYLKKVAIVVENAHRDLLCVVEHASESPSLLEKIKYFFDLPNTIMEQHHTFARAINNLRKNEEQLKVLTSFHSRVNASHLG